LLYIEDNLANLRLVERLLSHRIGIQLITAIKGTLGFELAQQHHPDLILMDVHLPDVSGLVLVERLRADPRTANVPIVMLSADATAGQIRRLLQAGANDYLTKPLEVSDFHSVINTYLKGKSDADDSSSLE
jgi:CheY-like chemotaxis protein